MILQPMRDAALSAFSRLPTGPAVSAAYVRMTRVIAAFACPLYFGAAALAPDLVVLLFGPQWANSGWIMSLLAIGVGANVFGYFLPAALTATNQTNLVLRTSLFGTAATSIASFASVTFGPVAVAAAHSLRAHLSVPFWLSLLAGKTQLNWRDAVGAMLPFWVSAVLMAVVVALSRWFLWPDAPLLVRLGAGVATGVCVYALVLRIIGWGHVKIVSREISTLLPKSLKRFFPTVS